MHKHIFNIIKRFKIFEENTERFVFLPKLLVTEDEFTYTIFVEVPWTSYYFILNVKKMVRVRGVVTIHESTRRNSSFRFASEFCFSRRTKSCQFLIKNFDFIIIIIIIIIQCNLKSLTVVFYLFIFLG